ncbi:calvin cycle protein CP12-3, chloroplastic [Phoenix dactylifera]|uniref:Calvin cycle protein CP12-3, chloroplastic n=1 Tax=Phoenix dactylifera TaxID=42345 RepID=A0A8B7CHL9_PHODC|nr:calvin cycle protein CP12-3, chloroplastic [Phoenix dactylifera]
MASSSSLSLSSLPLPSSSGLRSRSHRDPVAAIVSIPASRWWQGRRGSAVAVAASAARKKYKGTVMREEKLAGMIERKVEEAKAACEGEEGKGSDGCKVAWDEVEEVSQAMAHLRRRLAESDRDPLESFCQDNPETDECRVYED